MTGGFTAGGYFNATRYLVDRQLEHGNADRPAVRSGGRALTYRQLREQTDAVGAGLHALGVRPEERVVLLMADDIELYTAILAAMDIGAVAVPVSTMQSGPELGQILRDSRARTLVVSAGFAAVAQAALPGAADLTDVVLVGEGELAVPARVRRYDWAQVMAAGRPFDKGSGTVEDSPALWLYTSGTTGVPKAAVHRHANFRHVAQTYAAQVLGITGADVCYSAAKLFFAYGLGNSLTFPLSVGAAAVLEPLRATPATVTTRLLTDRPTLFFAGPSFYAALLAADAPADAFASVRLAVSAGEALPAAIFHRFHDRYGVEILDGIGSTEALHIFISNRPGQVRPGTSGQVVPGYQVALRGEDGAPAPVGQSGALFVRGESIADGYWCRAALTREVFQGEWLRTGDTYLASPDGYYTWLGRTDDMLKAGGIFVSPIEVEARLAEHPAVARAVVVGVPDQDGLDKPVAVIVAQPGSTVDEAELIAFCRQTLAAYKRPRHVVVVDELPTTATGKVQRFVLRQMVAQLLRSGAAPVPADPGLAPAS